jgi:hypothetical protein
VLPPRQRSTLDWGCITGSGRDPAVLLVHAALLGIPRELYEAAAVDGAGAWRRFWHVTLPLLRPIIAIILILRTSFAFAVFEEILAITQGGPGDATWVAAWQLNTWYFVAGTFTGGSALPTYINGVQDRTTATALSGRSYSLCNALLDWRRR